MDEQPQANLVTITINGVELQVPKGELIVESVKRLGLEVPVFCYHPRMKPVGMCRMCLVEVGFAQPDGSVRKMPKPQAACTLPADANMVITTDSEMVHRDRKGVLEFLLISHPLDCPICDRGGECPLQNNTLYYGPSTSRFQELKRHAIKAFPLSKYVTLDLERCIQCGRCVRFTEQISGDAQLAFRFRGGNMQPSTFGLTDFDSKFSGNVIEICPVGALTNSNYRFRARPWDLQSSPGVCLECSNHCNVWFDHRAGKFVRINGRTNEAVNEEWTCDKGKFGHDYYNDSQRATKVLVRHGRNFQEATWSDAYALILEHFEGKGAGVAMIAGGKTPNEGLYLASKLATGVMKTPHLDARWTRYAQAPEDRLESKMGIRQVQDTFAELESKKCLLVFGCSLADDAPMAFLRVRKAWFRNGATVVNAVSAANEASNFAGRNLALKTGHEKALAQGILKAALEAGSGAVPREIVDEIAGMQLSDIAETCGVSEADLKSVAASLRDQGCIVTTESILNGRDPQDTVDYLGAIALATGCSLNLYPLHANEVGARAVGFVPGKEGKDVNAILEACERFEIQALWLVDVDPFALHPNHRFVKDALENVDFLVVQSSNLTEASHYASVVLPSAAPAEQEGTYVNAEGRLQEFKKAIGPPGEAKPAWRIFAEFLMRTTGGKPYFNAGEVFADLAHSDARFQQAAEGLDEEGKLIQEAVKEVALKG